MTGVIQGLGKQMVPVFNLFIGFVLKVITMLILMSVPKINIQGAAVSTVVCYAYAGVADTIYMMRRTKMPVHAFDLFFKPALASAAMGGAVYIIFHKLSEGGHTTLATLTSVIVGVGVYALLVVLLKMFSRDELELIPGGGKLSRLMYRGGGNK